jgi:putative transposase
LAHESLLLVQNRVCWRHVASHGLQIRAETRRSAETPDEPIPWIVPLRLQRALAEQKEHYTQTGKKFRYDEQSKHLTAWKKEKETAWLKDAPAQPLRQKLMDLDKAFKNFFAKRAKPPKFKKKGGNDSFRFPQPKQSDLDEAKSRIELPKLGLVRYRNSRRVEGTIKNVTIGLRAGKWFMSVQTERVVPDPARPSKSAVGIDVGIVNLATLSNGEVIKPLNPFRKEEKRLAKLQRAQAKTKKHPRKNNRKKKLQGRVGKNWSKRQLRIQRKQAKIARRGKDHLDKASAAVCKNHATVVVEDLNIPNMSKSASRTLENPGRNAAAKSGLDKSILDQPGPAWTRPGARWSA